jgi:hypothetical protein
LHQLVASIQVLPLAVEEPDSTGGLPLAETPLEDEQ